MVEFLKFALESPLNFFGTVVLTGYFSFLLMVLINTVKGGGKHGKKE